MHKNTQEKSLKEVNENSIFYKIKRFFRNLFNKKTTIDSASIIKENLNFEVDNNKSAFIESIKNIEDEETQLLKLQKQYHSGIIREEDLTKEQVKSLCDLYDKQIEELRKSNELRKQKLAEYKRKLEADS